MAGALFLQRTVGNHAVGRALGSVQSQIDAMRGGGRPLSASLRNFFAPRFGHDLGDVRIHSDRRAASTANAINARAFTVGNDVVFGEGQYQPSTRDGQRLLAHELTHVVQQKGDSTSVQRQPDKPDPDAEREAAIRQARAESCSTDQIEAQSDAEDKLKLDSKKRDVKPYAWTVGTKDRDRIKKSQQLTADVQQEIIVKLRFFRGEAKRAYLQIITPAVSEYAESEQVSEIVNAPPCASVPAKDTMAEVPCDIGKHEFLLLDESDPDKTRCMNIDTDPEFKNVFDFHIARGVGHAVPETTWENVDYDRFKVLQVFYDNGKSEYFMLDDIGNFHVGDHPMVIRDFVYVKRATGWIYPANEAGLVFNQALTRNIIALKNGLDYQIRQLKDLYELLQLAGSFASIMGLYGLGVESFKASISAFRRGGVARLPGRPLPGIGVKPSPRAVAEKAFGELDGVGRGFRIRVVDDLTVHETPTTRSNIGINTKHQGGALTNLDTREIYVHQDLVNANGLVRKWGAKLDLKQVIAHELGHGVSRDFSCAIASRVGADLPGMSTMQRLGLLDDAVHISRASATRVDRVSLQQLNLPKGYTPPPEK